MAENLVGGATPLRQLDAFAERGHVASLPHTGSPRAISMPPVELIATGTVQSPLTEREQAPKQGREGSPEAWIVFEERFLEALDGIAAGDDVLVFTWLDRADRGVLRAIPRSDPSNLEQGVF